MFENVLEKIIKKKIERIDLLKKSISLSSLSVKINENKSFINFKDKIQNNINNDKISLIAEIKKASPSAGIIINNYDPLKIAEMELEGGVLPITVTQPLPEKREMDIEKVKIEERTISDAEKEKAEKEEEKDIQESGEIMELAKDEESSNETTATSADESA